MNEQEEKELRDEIFQEEMMRTELLKNFSSEDLVHVDNIITGINKLRESKPTSMSVWMMILMWLFGVPLNGFNGMVIPNIEENEAGKE